MKRPVIIGIATFFAAVAGFYAYTEWRNKGTNPPANVASAAHQEDVLVLGSISLTIKEEVAEFQPLADYLARHLKSVGISQVMAAVVPTIGAMAELIKDGDVDIYMDSPFPVLQAMELSGTKPFLRRWKRGKTVYHTVIFARKDSGLKTLKDLNRKMVAFDDPFSTSGYLVPKAMLLKEGLSPREYQEAQAEVTAGQIGYIFSEDDDNTMIWVLKKKVTAGALSDSDFEELSGERKAELSVLARSVNLPRQVVTHRAGLSPKLVEAIEGVLLNTDKDPEGRKVLEGFGQTKKFDKFPGGAETALAPVKVLLKLVEGSAAR